jgi:hypothetical protein
MDMIRVSRMYRLLVESLLGLRLMWMLSFFPCLPDGGGRSMHYRYRDVLSRRSRTMAATSYPSYFDESINSTGHSFGR